MDSLDDMHVTCPLITAICMVRQRKNVTERSYRLLLSRRDLYIQRQGTAIILLLCLWGRWSGHKFLLEF